MKNKEKHKVTFQEETYQKAEKLYQVYHFNSVSELIDTAVAEWLLQKDGEMASRYASKEMKTMIENTIRQSELRINRMLYRLAVSDTEIKHILAESFTIDGNYLLKLHDTSIREVRLTKGLVNLQDIIDDTIID